MTWSARSWAVLTAAAEFRRARQAMQAHEVARLRESVPLPQWYLPVMPVAGLDAGAVDALAGRWTGDPS